jgi:hypothetical protein
MFKESPVEKLIDYIKTLPDAERQLIAKEITIRKRPAKSKPVKKSHKKMQAFAEYIETLPSRLPKNYKFDREEANER